MAASREGLIRDILRARGVVSSSEQEAFLDPKYESYAHDPFLLPDMQAAVERLVVAHGKKESVVVYGDYDIDGLTATTVLIDGLTSFGFDVRAFIPNRFVEGYGLSMGAIDKLASEGAELILTVDCGSLSHKEIARAVELGVDVIVTDHHSVASTMPPAVGVINPKRLLEDHPDDYKNFCLVSDKPLYPFVDLAGVGVAFKLIQALQTRLDGLPAGQEKWLLDLVALGTVCDVVTLRDENRANVKWGLEVMKKTRRHGLRALMAVSRVKPSELTARSLGFGLGPRMNAAGRLETAQYSLDLLLAKTPEEALDIAERLDAMNTERRAEQDRIFQEAIDKAGRLKKDPVLVVSDPSWSHGIIGIVAAKLLEKYYKPTFVLQELPDGTAKGSARSFGDFSAVAGIRATEAHLIKGGGHKLAAGVTLKSDAIDIWRTAINEYYRTLKLDDQTKHLLAKADVSIENFEGVHMDLLHDIARLEPYGNGNPVPVFTAGPLQVLSRRTMGAQNQHVKYVFADHSHKSFSAIAFNKAEEFAAEVGDTVRAWFELTLNEWQGRRTVEGRLLRMENE